MVLNVAGYQVNDSCSKVWAVDLQHLYSDLFEKGKSCEISGRCSKTVMKSRTSQGPYYVTFKYMCAAGLLKSLTWLRGGWQTAWCQGMRHWYGTKEVFYLSPGKQTGRHLLTQERHLFKSGEMSSNGTAAPPKSLWVTQGGCTAGSHCKHPLWSGLSPCQEPDSPEQGPRPILILPGLSPMSAKDATWHTPS